jgi:arylsulfatase A-like enzyme
MLDYAGVPIPEVMQGKSLRPLVVREKDSLRKDAYFEHTYLHANNIRPSEGVRSEEWKYIRYFRQDPVREELFHLKKDPEELRDLAGNAEYADMLNRLRARCDEYRETLI